MKININKRDYFTQENEFNKITHNEFSNLVIRDKVGLFERIISLLTELSNCLNIKNALFYNVSHGGFIPINCSSQFENIYLINTDDNNIKKNIDLHKINNIIFDNNPTSIDNKVIIYSDNFEDIDKQYIKDFNPIILSTFSHKFINSY